MEILIALLLFGGGFYTGSSYEGRQQLETEKIVAGVRQASQESAAAEIAKIKIVSETFYQPVIETVRSEVKYRECRHDDATVRRINGALTGVAQ